jgi:Family of unknown function (DUF6500)
MNAEVRQRVISVCNAKIKLNAFFQNRNDDPQLLMEMAEWWIKTHQLNHFEKATKIKQMVEDMG